MSDNRSVVVTLRAAVGEYLGGIEKARLATRNMAAEVAKDTKANNQNLHNLGRTGLITGGIIAAGLGLAIKQFAEFDKAMSNVKAVTSATAAEMRQLREAAIQAGAATVFNAKDAADAEGELAKAGVSVRDILGGGLTGALNLAAAGQIGVADAANIAATAMVQFGKTGADVPHIADLLAAAANKAQGGVQDMAVALKYVGPIAHQMGISLEETTGTIAELANNGILADQAGTDLRGVLSSLTSPSKLAAKEMEALGINVYDAKGNFTGFAGVADQLAQHMGKLSNAERDQAFGRIFGNAQITAARILYAGGAADVNKWTKAVYDDGAAARIAHINLDNLAGDFEQLKGSIQTALIGQGSAGNAILRNLAQSATAATNAIGQLPKPVQEAGFFTAVLAAGTLLTVGALGTLVPKVRAARIELEGMGRAGTAASRGIGALGRVAGTAAVIALIGTALGALGNEIDKLTNNAPPEVDKLTRSLLRLGKTGQVTGVALETFGKGASSLAEDLSTLSGLSGTIGHLASATSGGLADRSWVRAKDNVDALDKSLAGLVLQGYPAQAKQFFGVLNALAIAGGRSAGDLMGQLDDYTNALAAAKVQELLAGDSAGTVATGLDQVSQSAQDAATAETNYKDALTDTTAIDAYTATAKTSQAFKDLTKNLKDGGKVTDAEKISLGDFASQVKSAAAALNDNGAAHKRVTGYLKEGRQEFVKAAVAAGYGADEAKRLARNLIAIPKYTPVGVNVDPIKEANRQLRILLALLARAGETPAVGRGIANKVHGNPGLLDVQARASGGPFGPGLLKVGEQGPELLWSSGNGTVTNAAQTQRILGGGTGVTTINHGNRTGVHLEPGAVTVTAGPQVDPYALAGQVVGQLSDKVWMSGGWDPT